MNTASTCAGLPASQHWPQPLPGASEPAGRAANVSAGERKSAYQAMGWSSRAPARVWAKLSASASSASNSSRIQISGSSGWCHRAGGY